jgi:hypothetical protein
MIPVAKRASISSKRRAALEGTTVTIQYSEMPANPSAVDPTTGARVDTVRLTKTLTTKAFIHFIAPIESGLRVHAEVEAGNCIVELPLDLVKIVDPGDTGFEVGQVVDQTVFFRANLAAIQSATADPIELAALPDAVFIIANAKWVQKSVGEELAMTWDAIYHGINLNLAFLLRKA